MTTKELQSLLKNAVREVFRDELKEILLEAIKNNNPNNQLIGEHKQPSGTSNVIKEELRQKYGSQFNINFNTNDVAPLRVNGNYNTAGEGTSLPDGEVSLNQIMNLMGK